MSAFYKGKVVWITGASSGIGKEIAFLLAKEGAHLILSASSKERLLLVEEACKSNAASCNILPVNLAEAQEVVNASKEALTIHQGIDILILNAGISQRSFIQETPYEVHQLLFQINYFSNIQIVNQVLPYMINQGYGHIAVTSSIAGKFGFPLRAAYSAAKHALHGFFETLRLEHHADNIGVTILVPGRVLTNISINALTHRGEKHGKMDSGQAGGMSSEKCAKIYIEAIRKNKNEVLIGGKEILMVYIKRFSNRLFHQIAKNIKPN